MKNKKEKTTVRIPTGVLVYVPRARDIIRELVREELIEVYRDELEGQIRSEIEAELQPVIEKEVRQELARDDEPDGLADLMYETWRDEQVLGHQNGEGKEVGA